MCEQDAGKSLGHSPAHVPAARSAAGESRQQVPVSRVEALILDDDGDDDVDGLLDARRRLLAVSDRKVLHEVRVDGHALDQLDSHGLELHDVRQLDIDEHATRHRFALFDSFCAGGLPRA